MFGFSGVANSSRVNPMAFFTYNRSPHTTVEALQRKDVKNRYLSHYENGF